MGVGNLAKRPVFGFASKLYAYCIVLYWPYIRKEHEPMEQQNSSNISQGALVGLSNELAGVVENVSGSLVRVEARRRYASTGIIWSQDGHILTADHTVESEQDIPVSHTDGRTWRARLVARDPGSDLALLKVDASGLRPIMVADRSEIKVGHLALALGNADSSGVTATFGIISAVGGAWRTARGGRLEGFVRSDAALYSGFSGGPLVNAKGSMVAVNSWTLSNGAGFAVPADTAARIAEALKSGGVKRAYLGIGTQIVSLPQSARSALQIEQETGLMIVTVEQNGPAEKSGLLIGDVLLALEGATLGDADDLISQLTPDRIGKAAQVRLIRGGKLQEIGVTVGQRE